jgi:hypothetical protein
MLRLAWQQRVKEREKDYRTRPQVGGSFRRCVGLVKRRNVTGVYKPGEQGPGGLAQQQAASRQPPHATRNTRSRAGSAGSARAMAATATATATGLGCTATPTGQTYTCIKCSPSGPVPGMPCLLACLARTTLCSGALAAIQGHLPPSPPMDRDVDCIHVQYTYSTHPHSGSHHCPSAPPTRCLRCFHLVCYPAPACASPGRMLMSWPCYASHAICTYIHTYTHTNNASTPALTASCAGESRPALQSRPAAGMSPAGWRSMPSCTPAAP